MSQEESFSRMLGALYAAPTNPELWSDFLCQLAPIIHVDRAGLLTHDMALNDHRLLGYLGDGFEEAAKLYAETYGAQDQWAQNAVSFGTVGTVNLGIQYCPDRELLATSFYNEYLVRFDVRHMAGVLATRKGSILEHLSVYRGHKDEAFDQTSLEALNQLIPHLQTALLTRRKLLGLEARVGDLESALDHLVSPLVLLNAKGKCIFVNSAARAILDQRNGLYLDRSKLCAVAVAEAANLRDAISRAVSTGLGKGQAVCGAVTISRIKKGSLRLLAAAFRSQTIKVPGQATAIVFINDPEQKQALPSEILKMLFGFTPAESKLAIALLHGHSLVEAAEMHHVGQETVRTQVKSLFQKTGTQRQGELIGLLAGLTGLRF